MARAFVLRVADRPDDDPLDDGATDERQRPSRRRSRAQIGQPFVPELPGQERREQGHLALGEVDQAGRPVDQDQGQGHRRRRSHLARRPRTRRSRKRSIQYPRYALRTPSSAFELVGRAAMRRSRPPRARSPGAAISRARLAFCSTISIVVPVLAVDLAERGRTARGSRAAPGRATARRAAAAGAGTSAPGRWPASAARRRSCCRPAASRRSARRGNISYQLLDVGADLAVAAARRRRPAGSPRRSGRRSCRAPGARGRRPVARSPRPACPTIDELAEPQSPFDVDHPADRPQRRGLAGAVGAEDHHDLALVDEKSSPCRTWTGP